MAVLSQVYWTEYVTYERIMPESKTDVLIWDGSQKNFTASEDKVFERFLDGNGGRTTQQWHMNSDASITEHT
jgi:hypothetical protein